MNLTRRNFLATTGLAGAGLFLGHRSVWGEDRERPNVVMIVSDDQAWTDFGFMGHKVIRTPRIDGLAKQSAVFPNGYVPTSLCRASLATLLTGLHPYQHKICCNDPPRGVDRTMMHPFIKNAPALPRLLAKADYRSLQTGKFWEGHFSNAGFTHGQSTNKDRHIHSGGQIGRTTMKPIYDFIDDSGKKPFFVWYAPMMPHTPHNPPERFLKKYRDGRDLPLAKYYAMCEWFDETCGQLLDYLSRKKLRDNTFVLFVVDNGWVQWTTKKRPSFEALRGKRTPYDGGIRTPVLLRWPGHTKAGTYNDLVSTVDLAPTILHACGLEQPKEMTGLDLLPVASGKQKKLDREAIVGEIYLHDCTKLGEPRLDVTHRWVREGDWKLIVPTKGKKVELFNLARDPHEKNNLAADQPERVKHLQSAIRTWVANSA